MTVDASWYEEAETWCKWYASRSHTQPYIYQVYNGEGDLQGMVANCVTYIWEKNDPLEGIKSYHAYLQREYGYVADGVRNNPSRIASLNDESLMQREAMNADPAAQVVTPKQEPFEGSLWGRLPILAEVFTTKKGGAAVTMLEWLEELPVSEQEMLLTYANVGIAEASQLLNRDRREVKLVIDKVRRAVARAA